MRGSSVDEESDGGDSVDADMACTICKSADNDDEMLVCDGCNEGYHFRCVGLEGIPETEEWYCKDCSSVLSAETYLKRHKLDAPNTWLSVNDLEFEQGDHVVMYIPGRTRQLW